ncbi:PREDICTED: telomere repeat-binding factor 5-like isoform X1 [Camelina sativa]|uniref:MYB transcription factor n=1 Tax=Camelina sativa TaxID=90675 RepID=A0ABM0STU1_CAMSA|nr:PREDICTED: telomere repeat-binding factor 5-like isoform X1 [Camelina sativa]
MGNQKLKWTGEEEEALLAGIAKHGAGKWKNILRDPEFSKKLINRSNIDLKDKWRNLSIAPGTQGSTNRARPTRVKEEEGVTPPPVETDEKTTPPPPIVNPFIPPVPPLLRKKSIELITDQSGSVDTKNVPRYDGMIFEALSALADANGSDVSSIFHFIEPRHEVPPNFRRVLSSRLRRLATQSKLVKVSTFKTLQNFYKIPDPSGTRTTPAPKPKETHTKSRQSNNHQASAISLQMIEEAAITAACKVVEAENKIDIAKAAGEEFEKMTKLAEGTEHLLVIANEIHEKCSRGEVVLLA